MRVTGINYARQQCSISDCNNNKDYYYCHPHVTQTLLIIYNVKGCIVIGLHRELKPFLSSP